MIASSFAASAFRLGLGASVGAIGPRPELPLELYEFEACPFCRKVREALTMLDLDAVIWPAPHGGTRYRPEAIARGGKRQFPLLVDPNEPAGGELIYESDAIVAHLYARYGAGAPPLRLRLGAVGNAMSALASAARLGRGRSTSARRAGDTPAKPLELWSFEWSPYCRVVREALCERELPYVLHNLGKRSESRPAFQSRHGKIQVPYLEDPNTGAKLFESRDIVHYLAREYGPPT